LASDRLLLRVSSILSMLWAIQNTWITITLYLTIMLLRKIHDLIQWLAKFFICFFMIQSKTHGCKMLIMIFRRLYHMMEGWHLSSRLKEFFWEYTIFKLIGRSHILDKFMVFSRSCLNLEVLPCSSSDPFLFWAILWTIGCFLQNLFEQFIF
jgi:hypothetical protein